MASDDRGEVRFGEHLTPGRHLLRSALTSGPGIAWVGFFLLLPLAWIGAISFMTRSEAGQFGLPWTIGNWKRLAGFGFFGFDFGTYPMILLRSVALAAGTALLCVLAALPLAFFIAALPRRYRNLALVMVLIPFWTNLLVRTYAWQILLAPESWITRTFAFLGLVESGQALYPGTLAIYIGTVCDYLPFIVLPLYSSVEKIDWSIAEAAMDLGADGKRVFWHAVLPQVAPGLVAGILLVFIPAMGQFVIPDLLGGAKIMLLGNAVQQQFGPSRDWPFGAAIAFVGMGVAMIGLWIYARKVGEKGGEIL